MKYIFFNSSKIISGLLLMVWLTAGCKKLIEIPPNPPTAITQEQQFADSATTMTALAGIYSYPTNGNGSFTFNDGLLPLVGGLSSDELTLATLAYYGDFQEFYTYGLNAFDDILGGLWGNPYTGMYPVNAALHAIENNNGLSTSFRQQITGELKVVRALYYFDLVNLFGGVPLVTSIDYTNTNTLPRASVDSIYGQIILDLTDAEQALAVNYASPGHLRPNLYTAKALLAKVYLYRQQWQLAYNEADSVISSGMYSLEPDPNNVFLDGSQEAIWQLPATGSYSVTKDAQNFVPYAPGVIPAFLVTPILLNAFETGDLRLQDWINVSVANTGSGNQNFYYPYKYKNTTPSSPTVEDFMILRLGETYLVRAEAAAQLNNTGGALADLNTVRARAGLPGSTASTQPDLLTAIMHERQTELFCEWGNRWLDLKRTGTAGDVLSAEKTGWQPNAVLYPVPNGQLKLNPRLSQNPGYN